MAIPATPEELFDVRVPKVLAEKKMRVGMVYLFKISGPGGGDWTVDLISPEPSCKKGDDGQARCTVEMSYDNLKKVMLEPLSAGRLYFEGKIKVVGDPQALLKLRPFLSALA